MDIVNANQARSQLFQPIDDWEAIEETLYLLSISGMGESIQAGMATSISECATELDW